MRPKSRVNISIWGETFEFQDFSETQLRELFDTFAGSVELLPDHQEAALTIRAVPHRMDVLQQYLSVPRHRGGSPANKYFVDGTPFVGSSQNRDIVPICDDPRISCYSTESALIVASRQIVLIFCHELPAMLLSDIVENWLLWNARQHGILMIHCSAWLHDGRVQMAAGSSGIGKTTQLFRQMLLGAQFFSNDRAFLRLSHGVLEARSFPLPVNIGCGTIRSLGLSLPDFGLEDNSKIRLTPRQVVEMYGGDYESWFPVDVIFCLSEDELAKNLYWDEDPSHPFWNAVFRPLPFGSNRSDFEPAIKKHVRLHALDYIRRLEI